VSSKTDRQQPIRFTKPFVTGNERQNIDAVFANGHFSGNGPFTKQVQTLLQDYFSIPHVLLTHSCTAALEITALLLDIKPGDQILLPSFNFVSAASACLRAGAELVFCEIDPETMNIDVDDVALRITPRSRAIIPVHYGGIGANMSALTQLADEHNLIIIEDAAQGLGAKMNGSWLGGIAPLATVSFHETKNIHCGLGGALFINDPDFFERAEDIWERGTNRGKMFKGLVDKYSWVEPGSSFYPSELQAAFLLAQLQAFAQNRRERKVVYDFYQQELQILAKNGLFNLPVLTAGTEINYHSSSAIQFLIVTNCVNTWQNRTFRPLSATFPCILPEWD